MRRSGDIRTSKKRLAAITLVLNALVLATLLTSSPQVSPASGWIVAVNRALYQANIKTGGGLVSLHADSSKLPKEDCIACHGTMKSHKLALHRIHLTSDLIPDLSCTDCHDKISLKPKSNIRVVHMVNVRFCKKCHSAFPAGPNAAMKPKDKLADCTTCHSGKHAVRHAQPYLSQIIGPRECLVCHGGRILPWTPKHEKADWVRIHGKLALGNVPRCMSCHEYGLTFCNDCHRNKPPSHKPRELWLEKHRVAARTETRACFTCHKTNFCKRCHINHTQGWRARHVDVVIETGTEPCLSCHSATFCDGCHIGTTDAQRKAGIR